MSFTKENKIIMTKKKTNEEFIKEIKSTNPYITIEGKHLMITTCYPFYYSGHAPRKYVVIASLS